MKALEPCDLKDVSLTSGLLRDRQKLNESVTVPSILRKLEETGRVASVRAAFGEGGVDRPHPFWDSDIGKTIEAIAYSLASRPDPVLEGRVDEIVAMLGREQYPDGYLNTYFRISGIEKRWTNLYYMHELYCAGHLMEGAVAYYEVTGKREFLEIMCRYADCIHDTFGRGTGKIRGYCGHPEIELALVRLYKATGNRKYLDLSKYFIDERGRQPYYFETESLARGVDTTKTANQTRHLKFFLKSRGPYAEYQAHKPVREQDEPVGHAVRAMYLYSGMTDIAEAYDDEELRRACLRIWDALTTTQFSIVGGIGPAHDGERFSFAYDLPNEHTYNESCASVALVFWAHRMLQAFGESRFADILEQTLYNVILSGVSSKGDAFFYANYLSVLPESFEHASASLIDKMKAERQEWFDVSCCPPNLSRLIGSLGKYMFSKEGDGIRVHLYAGSELRFTAGGSSGKLAVETDYPWSGTVDLTMDLEEERTFALGLRVPGWCRFWTVAVDGRPADFEVVKGYCVIRRPFRKNRIRLELQMPVTPMEAHPRVREDGGRIALQRGPVVYCVEEADNGKGIHDLSVCLEPKMTERRGIEGLSRDAVTLELDGVRRDVSQWSGELYRPLSADVRRIRIRAIPYFLWGNRGFGEMAVWLPRSAC